MSRFQACLKFVLEREGGYVNHPNDRGGATNKGITQRTYSAWRAANKMQDIDVKDITAEEVEVIYWEHYWIPAKCNAIPEPLDLCVFDVSVNSGPRNGIKNLQNALGVVADGDFGPKTLDALMEEIAADRVDMLVRDFIALRRNFYTALITRDPTQQVFEKGWSSRCDHLMKACGVV